jgi:putative sigma-54 modulation protein
METNFTFRNLDPTEGLKDHALQKMGKVKRYLLKPIVANIIFSLDKFRQRCEITLVDSGKEYVSSEISNDMYISIDVAVERLVSQLKKKKEKLKAHKSGQLQYK